MKMISHFQVRGVPGQINRVEIAGRIVDYWTPPKPSHLLIAHDGQNIFDPRTATKRFTWRMAQNAIKVFAEFGLTPPAIIGVFHAGSDANPFGRFLDLTPQNPFQSGVKPLVASELKVEMLLGNSYQQLIAEEIVPQIAKEINLEMKFENSAMVGSSMGGLATINALNLRKDFFKTALAFSPHWVIGGKPLVDSMLNDLPKPGSHKIWMSRGDRKLDATYKNDQDYADQSMHNLGWRQDFKSTVYKGAAHNERAWAKQIDDALRFWLLN